MSYWTNHNVGFLMFTCVKILIEFICGNNFIIYELQILNSLNVVEVIRSNKLYFGTL